ncbi:arsenite efflux protein-like protein [Gorgonomyces haynaldii]|nr:arsenite efflux protein-like protein [Gorgonomyces haynaldii]
MKVLSLVDRLLPVLILLSMLSGALLGIYVPSVKTALDGTHLIDNISLPVFVGLLLMIYPVFCKLDYGKLPGLFGRHSVLFLSFSFLMNWIICPLFMAALAWITLPDLPHYRVGVLLIGVARCIAMVLIWVDLADGDNEWCAILVSFNAILQMLLFSPLAYFYTVILGQTSSAGVDMWFVVKNVLIFLGIPFVSGFLTRFLFKSLTKKDFYERKILPVISPLALLGLLFTIFVMFCLQGSQIVNQIGNVLRGAVPLILYFFLVFFGTLYASKKLGFSFPMAITQSFTAASNNFELAMAVAIATFGVDSPEALTTTIGPLTEVPVLLSLVYLSKSMKSWYES